MIFQERQKNFFFARGTTSQLAILMVFCYMSSKIMGTVCTERTFIIIRTNKMSVTMLSHCMFKICLGWILLVTPVALNIGIIIHIMTFFHMLSKSTDFSNLATNFTSFSKRISYVRCFKGLSTSKCQCVAGLTHFWFIPFLAFYLRRSRSISRFSSSSSSSSAIFKFSC